MLIAATALAAGPLGLAWTEPIELHVAADAHGDTLESIVVDGPWRLVGSARGVRSYEARLPIRPRSLFFESAPEGMELHRGRVKLTYATEPDGATRSGSWSFNTDAVVVRVRGEGRRPRDGEFRLEYAPAVARESALYRVNTPGTDEAFAFRAAQVDDVTRRGVFLPAPSDVTWEVDVPAGAVLDLTAGILPPEIVDGTFTDGAELDVLVDGVVAHTSRLAERRFDPIRVSLAEQAGRRVRIQLRTRDADTRRDHVFVAAPTVSVPSAKPKRVLLVFVDTLRRDHVGAYGYGRGASPKIDAFAERGVIFDEARSVAPWTLPSARAALTGMQPEVWKDAATLPARLSALGWATAAYVGNVYLSSNFEMASDWNEHGCVNWPSAELEVERALGFLERNEDRDALLMVHFMDMHLPYKEPRGYRSLYAGAPPGDLGEVFTRGTLMIEARGNQEAVKSYLVARYDQNLRYVDDQVARLVDAVGEDAVVVFFSDHGEEFFDHGDLEHGHTLFEELLRIPFILRAPGVAPRRVSAPASLLDLTPTLLNLLGLPAEGLHGLSLAKLARGEADPRFDHRPISFGRPLYGNEAWGVVLDGLKYGTRSGAERINDLRVDSQEAANLRAVRDPAPFRAALSTALQRPVRQALRLTPHGRGSGTWNVEVHVPGGVEDIWIGEDPTRKSAVELEPVDAETWRTRFFGYRGINREVFVVPKGDDIEAVANRVTLRIPREGVKAVPLPAFPYDGNAKVIARSGSVGRTVDVTWAIAPLPVGEGASGFDPELLAALQRMGYLDDDRAAGGGNDKETDEASDGE